MDDSPIPNSPSPPLQRQQVKQIAKISPMMPISVLMLTSAQGYKLIHKYSLRGTEPSAFSLMCSEAPGRYFDKLGPLNLESLDLLTCNLVQFWLAAIYHPVTRVLLFEFVGLLATIVAVGLISMNRSSAGSLVRWGSTTAWMIAQVMGAGVVLPALFSLIIYNSSSSARASFTSSGSARAIMPALIIGYLIPTALLLMPNLFNDNNQVFEWFVAAWQLFPIAVSLVATPLSLFFNGVNSSRTTSDAMISTTLIIGALDTVALLSFLLHLYSAWMFTSQGMTLSDFIPAIDMSLPTEVARTLLTFDFLCCLIAIWTLIFYDTTRFAGVGKTSLVTAISIAFIGTVVLGPGAATAWAWTNIEKARLGALVADRPARDKKAAVMKE